MGTKRTCHDVMATAHGARVTGTGTVDQGDECEREDKFQPFSAFRLQCPKGMKKGGGETIVIKV